MSEPKQPELGEAGVVEQDDHDVGRARPAASGSCGNRGVDSAAVKPIC